MVTATEAPTFFDYSASPVPVRDDIVQAHVRSWERIRNAGNWWTGAERVEIAAEVRNALECDFCRERKAALSPYSVRGEHFSTAELLPAAAVDAVHRIVTDATRLTRDFLGELAEAGITDGHYVELLGVVVAVLSIDELHRGLGVPLAPLPDPAAGEPTRDRPSGLAEGTAWVPMLTLEGSRNGPNADLFAGMPMAPNVMAAMSLVPDAVRQLKDLSGVHYIPVHEVPNPSYSAGSLDRRQIELIAGRVSALNECFY